jgi:integrase
VAPENHLASTGYVGLPAGDINDQFRQQRSNLLSGTESPVALSMPLQLLAVHGATLTDAGRLPRYWAAVWSLLDAGGIAESTRRARLSHLKAFYTHVDETHGGGQLDDALACIDLPALGGMLEGFFLSLKNQPTPTEFKETRWRTAVTFVRSICERVGRTGIDRKRLDDIELRLNMLDRLYTQLRTSRRLRRQDVRSLPSVVLHELYDLATPGSPRNPFRNDATQWRFWVAFVLLLHQGLRRGELLALPLDVVKSERSQSRVWYWMNVKTNEYEEDPRYSKPSIKTAVSIRQQPMSPAMARLVETYISNFRGRPSHSFLINSDHDTPLSVEALGKGLRKLSHHLSKSTLQILQDRTGNSSVSAHRLRHTCAVVRLHQLLIAGDPMPEALQKMRSFFGWSVDSPMPQRYAKAVFESRLASVWNDAFDDRVALIRSLESAS